MKRKLKSELKARVDDRTRVYVEEIAEEEGLTTSDILRIALRKFLHQRNAKATS